MTGSLLTLLPVALISRYRHQRDWRTLLRQGAALMAAALLWRLHLLGHDLHAQGAALLAGWDLAEGRAGHYAFNDVHAVMAMLVVCVVWQVFSRYVLAQPSTMTDEIARFSMIWVGLLGAAYVSGKNEHLAIDLLLQHIRPSRRKLLRLFIFLIVFLFAVFVLIVGGTWLVYTRFHLGVTSASLEINLGYVYLALPLGGLLTAYYAVDNAIALFRSSNS